MFGILPWCVHRVGAELPCSNPTPIQVVVRRFRLFSFSNLDSSFPGCVIRIGCFILKQSHFGSSLSEGTDTPLIMAFFYRSFRFTLASLAFFCFPLLVS
jgi:hypothetical protein